MPHTQIAVETLNTAAAEVENLLSLNHQLPKENVINYVDQCVSSIDKICASASIIPERLNSMVYSLDLGLRTLNSSDFIENTSSHEIIELTRKLNRSSIPLAKTYASEFNTDIADSFVNFLSDIIPSTFPSSTARYHEILSSSSATIELLGHLGYHSQRLCAGLSFTMQCCSSNALNHAIQTLGSVQGLVYHAIHCYELDDMHLVYEKNNEWFVKALLKRPNEDMAQCLDRVLSVLDEVSCHLQRPTPHHDIMNDFESVGLLCLLHGTLMCYLKHSNNDADVMQSDDLSELLSHVMEECVSLASRQCLLSQGCLQDKTFVSAIHRISDIMSLILSYCPASDVNSNHAILVKSALYHSTSHSSMEELCTSIVRRVCISYATAIDATAQQQLLAAILSIAIKLSQAESCHTFYADRACRLLQGLIHVVDGEVAADIAEEISNIVSSSVSSTIIPDHSLCQIDGMLINISTTCLEQLSAMIINNMISNQRYRDSQRRILNACYSSSSTSLALSIHPLHIKCMGNVGIILAALSSTTQPRGSNAMHDLLPGDKRKLEDGSTSALSSVRDGTILICRRSINTLMESFKGTKDAYSHPHINLRLMHVAYPLLLQQQLLNQQLNADVIPLYCNEEACLESAALGVMLCKWLIGMQQQRMLSQPTLHISQQLAIDLFTSTCALLELASNPNLLPSNFERARESYNELCHVAIAGKAEAILAASIPNFVSKLPKTMKNQKHSRKLATPEMLPYIMAHVKGQTYSHHSKAIVNQDNVHDMIQ